MNDAGMDAVTPWHLLVVAVALLVSYMLGAITGFALGRAQRRLALRQGGPAAPGHRSSARLERLLALVPAAGVPSALAMAEISAGIDHLEDEDVIELLGALGRARRAAGGDPPARRCPARP